MAIPPFPLFRGDGPRRLLIIENQQTEALKQAADFILTCPQTLSGYLYSEQLPANLNQQPNLIAVNREQAQNILGDTAEIILFDFYSGVNPNLLAALCGTLRAGGTLIITTPNLDELSQLDDPEYQRFTDLPIEREQIKPLFLQRVAHELTSTAIGHRANIALYDKPVETDQANSDTINTHSNSKFEARLHEQSYLVRRLTSNLNTPTLPQQVHILTADRGRGKSSALGLIAGQLLLDAVSQNRAHPLNIVVSAPKKKMVTAIFERSAHLCRAILNQDATQYRVKQGKTVTTITTKAGEISYQAPMQLTETNKSSEAPTSQIDLLIIDEAATIPISQLVQLIKLAKKVIIATTTDGYEGTGQYFQIRFMNEIAQQTDNVIKHTLHQPIRWESDDPLETLLNQLLLLKPTTNPISSNAMPSELISSETDKITITHYPSNPELREHELEALFSLLQTAHYRTTPSDLRQILDAPQQHFWILRYEALPEKFITIGVIWGTIEGELPDTLSSAIRSNQRRLRGHLLPQTRLLHMDDPDAGKKRYLRVIRIAIAPSFQGQMLGSRLLQQCVYDCKGLDCQAVGSSFSARRALLSFWESNGFSAIHQGHKVSPVTGAKSVVMMKWLSS